MYHAIMTYYFKPEFIPQCTEIWNDHIADVIRQQPGFVDVQFYVQGDGTGIAIGSWEDAEFAQAFMRTGVFANLLKALEGMMIQAPQGGVYQRIL